MPSSHPPQRAERIRSDVFEVAQTIAREYVDQATGASGVQALAAKLGTPAGTLYNKLNPHESQHHKLTLQDVIQISSITGDLRLLKSLAQTLGCICFPVPNLDQVSDEALLDLINKIGAEGGDFYRAVNSALQVRFPVQHDVERIHKEGLEFIGAIVEAMVRTEGLLRA